VATAFGEVRAARSDTSADEEAPDLSPVGSLEEEEGGFSALGWVAGILAGLVGAGGAFIVFKRRA
jgi:hypothetical protein